MWRTRLALWGPLGEAVWSVRDDRVAVRDLVPLLGPAADLEEGLALLAAHYARLPERVRRRLPGDGRALADALRAHHDDAVGPRWSRIRDVLRAEQMRHSLVMATDGIDAMLGRLHPSVRWRPPVLAIAAGSGDVRLGGRGLVLAGSLSSGPTVALFEPRDRSRPPLLVYPVEPDETAAASIRAAPGADDALRTLLGTTRAKVLAMIARRSPGTVDLARELGISPSGASQHATVLRRAGLITTRREDQAVRHAVTALGSSLLERRSAGRRTGHGVAHRERPHDP